jgi:ribonuclease BN (tRNA processing enzyme)
MRTVTVLGSCGAYPEPGRASSGFLVQWNGFRLVLDLGYATFPRLLAHGADIDAVAVTHEHPDHCVDLHALFRMRFYGPQPPSRLPLYCPPGVLDRLSGLEPDVPLDAVFDIHELPGSHQVGPFRLTGIPLPHHVPNAGIRLEADDAVLAYTGDCGPDPRLADLGRNADLFVVEATDRPGRSPHLMTADDAGRWAARAGARRLMLTHFWPGNDRARAVAAARAHFAGEVLAADEDLVVAV